ncbi:MAG: M20 family metallopeptidase [Meiothermus sp.]|nr:M20 family metallopeptidase [Meiothermus sp.]
MNSRLQEAILNAAQAVFPQALELSRQIHAHPELRFEEFKASAWLAEALERDGFTVQRGVGSLPTAFIARLERGPGPHIALLAEYDALEGLGHACGHNLIGSMSTGAGMALAKALTDLEGLPGTISVIGCPAEEGGGGKALLLEAGAFTGVDAAFIIHPYDQNLLHTAYLARVAYDITYLGVPAHAADSPHEGVNALDAANLFFAGLNALRQHVTPDVRMHGIITHGGDAPNIIPKETRVRVFVRAGRAEYLQQLISRVQGVIHGAAMMTGCRVEVQDYSPPYLDMRSNPVLMEVFRQASEPLGRSFAPSKTEGGASTDVGNVSHALPTLHPTYAIGQAKPHTEAFAQAAISPAGEQCLQDGIAALALSVATLLEQPQLVRAAWEAHRAQGKT